MMISSSRTSRRAYRRKRVQMCLSFVSLTTKSCSKYFGANRKDVINLTTKQQKKRTKSRHCTCFLPPAICKERISKSHTRKKGEE